MPDLVSLSAAVGLFLPAALTYAQEEWVGASPGLGSAVDKMNAALAGVQPNAVLLARLKKLVKGMKWRQQPDRVEPLTVAEKSPHLG